MKILVIHGPNLNLLGKREPDVYGRVSMKSLDEALRKLAKAQRVTLEIFQSNHEGEIVTKIQQADGVFDAALMNPAAYTHTSVAIRDAVSAVKMPVVEVHLSNIYAREEFRHHSHISGVARGMVIGFGGMSYDLALEAALRIIGD